MQTIKYVKITVYDTNILFRADRTILRMMAQYLGVSQECLFYRLDRLDMLEHKPLSEYDGCSRSKQESLQSPLPALHFVQKVLVMIKIQSILLLPTWKLEYLQVILLHRELIASNVSIQQKPNTIESEQRFTKKL